ncbi:MAG: hypothetical protein J6Y54_03730 [Lentisphaeria bacterium]|nr:hypothetical protein [Lentisphaeria bacterium]
MANVFTKEDLTISAGCVYGDVAGECRYIAKARGGKVVRFNSELELTDAQKQRISAFVAEAEAAQ